MNHISFLPYHNRHISFQFKEGVRIVELSGVVVDTLKYNEKKSPTEYVFIPTKSMVEWHEAHNKGDKKREKELERVIDIRNIVSAKLLR